MATTLSVTRDSDGGLTVHDSQSNLVISIIASNPDANGPHGVFVEVYDYHSKDVLMQDATKMADSKGEDQPLRLSIARHPTVAFYPSNSR